MDLRDTLKSVWNMKYFVYYKRCKTPSCYSVLKHDVVQNSGENEELKEDSF